MGSCITTQRKKITVHYNRASLKEANGLTGSELEAFYCEYRDQQRMPNYNIDLSHIQYCKEDGDWDVTIFQVGKN